MRNKRESEKKTGTSEFVVGLIQMISAFPESCPQGAIARMGTKTCRSAGFLWATLALLKNMTVIFYNNLAKTQITARTLIRFFHLKCLLTSQESNEKILPHDQLTC